MCLSFSRRVIAVLLCVYVRTFHFSHAELYKHFKTIAESVPETPVLLYNNPGRVGYTLSAQLVDELAHNVPNIVGMKDTSGDITQTAEFMVVQCAAAIPGRMNGIDTHWIWQEGRERLTKQPMQIVDGCIDLPKVDGLGIEVDREQVMKAHQLYMDKCYGKGARNDAVGMQYLIPGWKFDNKKPCLVR